MISPDWLFTDPIPPRTKGWAPRPRGGVKLRQAFMTPEQVGSGQDEPLRDKWYLDSPAQSPYAASAVDALGPQQPSAGTTGGPPENEAPSAPAPISAPPAASPPPSTPLAAPTPPAEPAPARTPPPNATPWVGKVYSEAASVADDVGVDPAIIATIGSTETGGAGQGRGHVTLGIGVGAGDYGRGDSGMSWGNPTPEGGRQPTGFWAYTNGAEAARAFRKYIERWQPSLVPYLNDAAKFFDPNGPISRSNYYVPTAAEAARAGGAANATRNYYANWLNTATGLKSTPVSAVSPATTDSAAPTAPSGVPSAPRNFVPGAPSPRRVAPGNTDQVAASVGESQPVGVNPNRTLQNYFSYSDRGREVMEVEWDDGTEYYDLGETQQPDGTVIQTGTLGNKKSVGSGQDDRELKDQTDPLKRQYPVIGPFGGFGIYDPRIGPAPEQEGTSLGDLADINLSSTGDAAATGGSYDNPLRGTESPSSFPKPPEPSGPEPLWKPGDKIHPDPSYPELTILGPTKDPQYPGSYDVTWTDVLGNRQTMPYSKNTLDYWAYQKSGMNAGDAYDKAFGPMPQGTPVTPTSSTSPAPSASSKGLSFQYEGKNIYIGAGKTGTHYWVDEDGNILHKSNSMPSSPEQAKDLYVGLKATNLLDPGYADPRRTPIDPGEPWTPPGDQNAPRDPHTGMSPGEEHTIDRIWAYVGGEIDASQLANDLGFVSPNDIYPEKIQQYAIDQAKAGNPWFLKELPQFATHQIRNMDWSGPQADTFRQYSRMGVDDVNASSPYRHPDDWTPSKLSPGEVGGHGEVHTAGIYMDTDGPTATDRYSGYGDAYTRMFQVNFKPGEVLDMQNDPDASRIMQDAHTAATQRYADTHGGMGWDPNVGHKDPNNFGFLLRDQLLTRGYKAVYGGGFDREVGELVVLDDYQNHGGMVADGPRNEMITKLYNVPGFDPKTLTGYGIASVFTTAGAAAAAGTQRPQGPQVQPQQPDVGVGQDDGGDDQTEWPVPSSSLTDPLGIREHGGAPSTTNLDLPSDPTLRGSTAATEPSPSSPTLTRPASSPPPTTSDSQTEWPVPQPSSATTSSPDTTSTSPGQTWEIPNVGSMVRSGAEAVSGTIGAAASSLGQGVQTALQDPGEQIRSDVNKGLTAVGGLLPDITDTLNPPDASTPFGQVVAAGTQGQAAPATTQLASVPDWFGTAESARNEAATALNPARDVPVLGGAIEDVTDPAMWFPMGAAERAAKAVGKATLGSAVEGARSILPGVAEGSVDVAKFLMGDLPGAAARSASGATKAVSRVVADSLVSKLWDPATHAFQQSWDALMPDSVTARAPGVSAAGFAAHTAEGAVIGGGTTALTTDRNDPNYWTKVSIGGIGGIAGAHVAAHFAPDVLRLWRDYMAPVENVANPAVRESIATRANNLVSSRGQRWMWENRIEEVLGKPGKGNNTLAFMQQVEENGLDFASYHGGAPNTETQQLVRDMLKFTQDTGDEGRSLGYIRGDVTTRADSRGVTLKAYMPRVLKDDLNAAKQAPDVWHGKFNPNDNYTHFRANTSIYDGLANGVNYADSVSAGFGHYAEHVNASRANSLFLKDLKRVAPGAVRRIKSRDSVPPGWIWGADKSIGGMRQWQNVAFSPELKNVLHNITGPGIQDPLFRGALDLASSAKHALFAPSLFHLGNEVRQVFNAAGARGIPIIPKTFFYILHPSSERKFWANPSVMAEAKEAMDSGLTLLRRMPDVGEGNLSGLKDKAAMAAWGGVTSGAAGYTNARFDSSMTEEDRIKRGLEAAGIGAVGGALGGTLSKALWRDAVPYMKFMTWRILKDKYGPEATSSFVNSVYGGQNLEAIARSRKVQDVLRMSVLAPDWQEGWIRQVGNAFKPGAEGDLNRQYWARAAVTSAFALEGLNLALNGHFSWDNGQGHELTLETTGLYDKMGWDHTDSGTGEKYRTYVDMLGPYRGMLNAPLNPGAFLGARTGLVPEELSTAFSGKDWRGKDIAPPGSDLTTQGSLKALYLLSRLAPVGPADIIRNTQQANKEPLPLVLGQSIAGLRETRQSPLQLKVQQTDRKYRDIGFSIDDEARFKAEYGGALRQAERKMESSFDPAKKHSETLNDLQHVDWPNRQERLAELEPTEIAADPIRNADWVTKMKEIQSIGVQSGQGNADPDWTVGGTSLDSLASVYWSPPGYNADTLARLPQDAQDRLREKALVDAATTGNIEPSVARDAIKAQARGMDLPKLPGVTSDVLDQWVDQYRSTVSDDPQTQAEQRRAFVDQTAQKFGIDPTAVYQRIKLRSLPLTHEDPTEPGISDQEKTRREMQISYERAQDVLYGSKDPTKYPKYANPDGTPYKGSTPEQWAQFDQQVAKATGAGAPKTKPPEVTALIEAHNAGDAKRLKDIYTNRQASTDYQRWFGVGRNMDEAHWQEYATGSGRQFTDIQDPTENRRRTRTLELWKASTPKERQTTQVKVKIAVNNQVREVVTTLEQAKKHIETTVDPGWKTDLGLDTTGATP